MFRTRKDTHALFHLGVGLLALSLFAWSVILQPAVMGDTGYYIIWTALIAIGVLMRVQIGTRVKMGVGIAPMFAVALLYGPVTSMIMTAIAMTIALLIRPMGKRRSSIFSTATLTLATGAASWATVLTAGSSLATVVPQRAPIPIAVAAAVFFLVNSLTIHISVDLRQGLAPLTTYVAEQKERLPQYLLLLLFGGVAGLFGSDPLLALLLVGVPMGIAGLQFEQLEQLRERFLNQALFDQLTGLENRSSLEDSLARAIRRASRHKTLLAVVFLDLDNFKRVNDTLGHQAGDKLLAQVAERLRGCLRLEDTAARLGGDEFALLIEDALNVESITLVAERILEQFHEPLMIDGVEVFTSPSIGIAISDRGAERGSTLLANADLAMYHAKSRGKAQYVVFHPMMSIHAKERVELEDNLRRALSRNEMRVFYQPVVHLETGRVLEVEALLRWQHPSLGLLLPASFMQAAEETGLIIPIGRWVLEQVCRDAANWSPLSPSGKLPTISFNLSSRQFRHPEIVDDIARIIKEAGLEPARLRIEVSEFIVMQSPDYAIDTLWRLKQLGLQLAIDDFGTSYSSLVDLNRLPIDVIKIDGTLIGRLGREPEGSRVIRSMIALASSLSLVTSGENIETIEQLAHLQEMGCDRGQGLLFAEALPAETINGLLVTGSAVLHLHELRTAS